MRSVNHPRVYILCSSPNLRGIHSYASNALQLFPNSTLLTPPGNNRIVWLLWESFYPIYLLLFLRNSVLIFANTRVSPLAHILKNNNYLISILHDLMDTLLDPSHYVQSFSLKSHLNTFLISTSLRFADSVVSNSYYTQNTLAQFTQLRDQPCHVLHPQLSFRPNLVSSVVDQLRLGTSYPPLFSQHYSSIYFSLTGLTPNKSPDSYFDLIKGISSYDSSTCLYYLVGIPSHLINLESIQSQFPNVTLLPLHRVSESTLISLYLLSDAFISLSKQEGFGIPLHDAIAFDIQSYATRIPPFLEISSLHPHPNVTYLSPASLPNNILSHLPGRYAIPDRMQRALTRAGKYLSHYSRHTAHIQRQAADIPFKS